MYCAELKVPENVKTAYGLYEVRRFEDSIVTLDNNPNTTIINHRNYLFAEEPSLLDDIKSFEKFTCLVKFDDYVKNASLFALYTPTFDMDGLKKWAATPPKVGSSHTIERKRQIYESIIDAISLADKPELIQVTAFLKGREITEPHPSRKITSYGQMKHYVNMMNILGGPRESTVRIEKDHIQTGDVVRRVDLPIELPKPNIPRLVPDTTERPVTSKPKQEDAREPVACKIKLIHEPHNAKIIGGIADDRVSLNIEPIHTRFGIFCNHSEYELNMVEYMAPYNVKDKLVSMCEVRDYPCLDFKTFTSHEKAKA